MILFRISVVIIACGLISCQSSKRTIIPGGDAVQFEQIVTDSLFGSKQQISILKIKKNSSPPIHLAIAYNTDGVLKRTSVFARSHNALGAVNAGFFDMKHGNSVTYLEDKDSVVGQTKASAERQKEKNYFLNGAIVLAKDGKVYIQKAKSDIFYKKSTVEDQVLVTGPLLILNQEKIGLNQISFVTKRHPRTAFCISDRNYVLVTVDGRNPDRNGMSLFELQEVLQNLGCKDAVNLDGGGSTTMWVKNRGVVNSPSDSSGERPVANVLLVLSGNK